LLKLIEKKCLQIQGWKKDARRFSFCFHSSLCIFLPHCSHPKNYGFFSCASLNLVYIQNMIHAIFTCFSITISHETFFYLFTFAAYVLNVTTPLPLLAAVLNWRAPSKLYQNTVETKCNWGFNLVQINSRVYIEFKVKHRLQWGNV
jgi:hypothetical protein